MKNNLYQPTTELDTDLSATFDSKKDKCDNYLTITNDLTGLYLQSYIDRYGLGQTNDFVISVQKEDGNVVNTYSLDLEKSTLDADGLYTYFFKDIPLNDEGVFRLLIYNDVEGVATNYYKIVNPSEITDCYNEISYNLDCDSDSIPFSNYPVTQTFYTDKDSIVGVLSPSLDIEEDNTESGEVFLISRKIKFTRTFTVRNINESSLRMILEATNNDSLKINGVSYNSITLNSIEYADCCVDPLVLELVEDSISKDSCCNLIDVEIRDY